VSTMQTEVFEALRAIDRPEEKALKAAAALSRRDEDVSVLKGDVSVIKADVGTLKTDVAVLKTDVGTLKGDVRLLRWMAATNTAIGVAVLLKLFVH
jgi:hypothetical protein